MYVKIKFKKALFNLKIKNILKKHNIKKNRISKYCLTTLMLNNKIKVINFKKLILKLEKFNIIDH